MNIPPQGEITQLLQRMDADDETAMSRLVELVYDELRTMAADLMRQERGNHTLQPTALVHEAAVRLLSDETLSKARSRAYFFWAASRAMRQALVDHARAHRAQRRGGGRQRLPLDVVVESVEQSQGVDLLVLDESLRRLESLDRRKCDVVTLRFFGGLEMQEIAQHLDVSLSSVEKDWHFARAWLREDLRSGDTGGTP